MEFGRFIAETEVLDWEAWDEKIYSLAAALYQRSVFIFLQAASASGHMSSSRAQTNVDEFSS